MARSCLFCGCEQSNLLSDEHVIPQWLLEFLGLPPDDQMFLGAFNAQTSEFVGKPRVHSSFAFVEGRVCEPCNTGWMSRLEAAAKPILIPLMTGSRLVESLSSAEAALVGKWSAKTAYLHTWAGPFESPAPLQHLKTLNGDAGSPAPTVAVFAMQSAFVKPSGFFRSDQWPQLGVPEASGDAYKIGLQFKRLHLLTAYWPNPKSLLVRNPEIHTRLLPCDHSPGPEYHLAVSPGHSPVASLDGFVRSLGVWHRPAA